MTHSVPTHVPSLPSTCIPRLPPDSAGPSTGASAAVNTTPPSTQGTATDQTAKALHFCLPPPGHGGIAPLNFDDREPPYLPPRECASSPPPFDATMASESIGDVSMNTTTSGDCHRVLHPEHPFIKRDDSFDDPNYTPEQTLSSVDQDSFLDIYTASAEETQPLPEPLPEHQPQPQPAETAPSASACSSDAEGATPLLRKLAPELQVLVPVLARAYDMFKQMGQPAAEAAAAATVRAFLAVAEDERVREECAKRKAVHTMVPIVLFPALHELALRGGKLKDVVVLLTIVYGAEQGEGYGRFIATLGGNGGSKTVHKAGLSLNVPARKFRTDLVFAETDPAETAAAMADGYPADSLLAKAAALLPQDVAINELTIAKVRGVSAPWCITRLRSDSIDL